MNTQALVSITAPVIAIFVICSPTLRAQVASNEDIVVTAQDPTAVPSAYGAPSAFSQSRFAPLTNAYVLPPGEVYTSMIYELDVVHYRSPDHHWTEECEIGLPWRFNVAVETDIERYNGDGQFSTFS